MRKKNEITEYVAAALIFVCAVAVSLGIFLVCTQNSIERNSQKVIKTNVSRQSEHIKAILDIHYGYLRGIAKEIGKSEELVSDENMEMLISLEEETALERTALIEKLRRNMKNAAKMLEFEYAAQLRDRIAELEREAVTVKSTRDKGRQNK